jgi:hypothetical protein
MSAGSNGYPASREVIKRRLDVDRLPQHDDVHHETQRAELVLLTRLVMLAQLAPATVQDIPRQAVAALATVELTVDGSPVDRIVAVVQATRRVLITRPSSARAPGQAGRIRRSLQG